MRQLRAAWRALRAIGHVLRGLWIIRSEFGRLTLPQTQLLVREWSRQMLAILGVELLVQGTPPAHGPLLMVSNHMSWLDILVLNAAHPSRFVSKADVKSWPLLGSLITGAGTLYIERESRRDAMRVVHHMAERLRAGDVLTVFPEGTTGDGRALLPFHANLLQAAIAANAPVLPLALSFVDSVRGGRHDAPLFIGDTTLVASIWTTLCADGVQAQVRYGEAQPPRGRDRRTWSQDLRTEVERLRSQPD
ncbi:MAG: lysophospholipid acyltransferase family protein [Hydrogenophaga sp.]|uniref:lysophospholipid acyltransferase family protein n=1 Tax=Hydrogenophaga sp. TaxID=1904254 RepID=UPI002ABA2C3F|nr:lysophospholipid acyltransferase family protein [Hydrogenophaga sp.]MDZ4103635.1 lysophospholipid acyltransferase family protein [Hydrogenophaga sp.]